MLASTPTTANATSRSTAVLGPTLQTAVYPTSPKKLYQWRFVHRMVPIVTPQVEIMHKLGLWLEIAAQFHVLNGVALDGVQQQMTIAGVQAHRGAGAQS